ncbi:MAG TPA: glycosyltransferase 87 family protein [Pseudonocardiaceae bacterium]|nr:glycosyltransferase 87 family protein [Pseudonocardiaceae bacterium]
MIDRAHRAVALDVALYLVFAVFAGTTALSSEFYGARLWAALAVFGYLFGLAHAILPALRSRCPRYAPVAAVAGLGMIVSLAMLLVRRAQGVPWSEQPEVWVIERSATMLLHHGTPYINLAALGRPPIVDDYMPYGPTMAVFGLPSALFGLNPLTDARVTFAVFSTVIVVLALRLLRWPRVPVRAAQLIVAGPLTGLAWSTAGDDLPIAALMLLAFALLARCKPAWCGAVIGTAVSMKLTAAPALLVLAIAVPAILGAGALLRFLAGAAAAGLLTVPVFLVDPANFVEQVIRFPIGLGRAHSPAASPLPGNLLARLGPGGHIATLALLILAGLAMAVWLIRRPPRSAGDAALRTAIGIATAIILAPATRYGYLAYPIILLGGAITLRAARSRAGGGDDRVGGEPEHDAGEQAPRGDLLEGHLAGHRE